MPQQALRNRISYFLERWLPASILIMVACGQIFLAQTANLSPWKGGGFGMFAAVDAPSMRVIMATGLDQEGQLLRLDVSSALDIFTLRRILTLPKTTDLVQIASQLVSQPVVPTTIQRQAAYEKLLTDNPNLEKTAEFLSSLSIAPFLLSQPLYRLKTSYDPIVPEAIKTLKAVRLQWWRIRFDRWQKRLWAEPLSQVIEAGAWE
ncbi:MAG TPA: hypothetical protein ACFCUY_13005 [Xenococcaceae cyanobacterium]